MIYKFQSRSTGDVIMLGPNGDEVLALIGKKPAPQGVIAVDDMPAAIATLEQAVSGVSGSDHHTRAAEADDHEASGAPGSVSLKQRVWPLLDMMKRSVEENHDIVWGV